MRIQRLYVGSVNVTIPVRRAKRGAKSDRPKTLGKAEGTSNHQEKGEGQKKKAKKKAWE